MHAALLMIRLGWAVLAIALWALVLAPEAFAAWPPPSEGGFQCTPTGFGPAVTKPTALEACTASCNGPTRVHVILWDGAGGACCENADPGECSGGNSHPINSFPVAPGCAAGSTLVGSECIPTTCVSRSGKEVDYGLSWTGSFSDPDLTEICLDGCVAKVRTVQRTDIQLANGTQFPGQAGIAIAGTAQCSSQHIGVANSGYRTVTGARASGSGGKGSQGGGITTAGQGFNATDALNLERIATNTDRIGEAGDGSPSSGATRQDIEDLANVLTGDGAEAHKTAVEAGIQEAKEATSEAIDATKAAIEGTPPDFGASSRWEFSLNPFRGIGEQCSYTWTMTLPMMAATKSMTLDLCPYTSEVQSFLYWAFGIWTAYGLWSTIYGRREE